jgi:SAM-dependent methyltransferase
MISLGAEVVSVDLSSAIEVVARKLRINSNWVGVQGDIMHLPFADGQFDVVYCEGVMQHTQDSAKTVLELCRILKIGGNILATHYVRVPVNSMIAGFKRKITTKYYDFLRNRFSRMECFKLLFVTGVIATLNYVPVLGFLLRKTGMALYYDLMPDFKTTWTNTFDYYGSHKFQRFIAPEEFWGYFENVGNMELILKGLGIVVAQKLR